MAKSKFDQYYTELPELTAKKLRDARVKPEQLTKMEDGTILAIEGITDTDLEQIRLVYQATIKEDSEIKAETKTSSDGGGQRSDSSEMVSTKKPKRNRSARYNSLKNKIKKDKAYPTKEAVELIQKISKPTHTLELHLNITENNLRGEVHLPHSTGKDLRVAIFNQTLEDEIKTEKINFDILLTTPQDMPKLARYARFLGPKGLMPNPKNQTVTEDPAKRKKELEAGATLTYKTEVKFPIIHLGLGKTNQEAKKIQENIEAVLKEVGIKKITSAHLASTQSPGIKLNLSEK
jgi:large subunit ribosomal protein L1